MPRSIKSTNLIIKKKLNSAYQIPIMKHVVKSQLYYCNICGILI